MNPAPLRRLPTIENVAIEVHAFVPTADDQSCQICGDDMGQDAGAHFIFKYEDRIRRGKCSTCGKVRPVLYGVLAQSPSKPINDALAKMKAATRGNS
jgi:hypothetical protein